MEHLNAKELRTLANQMRTHAFEARLPPTRAAVLERLLIAAVYSGKATFEEASAAHQGASEVFLKQMEELAERAETRAKELEGDTEQVVTMQIQEGDPSLVAAALLLRYGGRIELPASEAALAFE